MADQRIDFSCRTENEDRQLRPERETRPQVDKEKAPDYYNRQLEKEGRSEWSGAWAGGRSR
jgi:hypothetical protein